MPEFSDGPSAQPITIGEAKEAAEAKIGVGRDGALAGHDGANALGRNADFLGQPVVGNTHGLKELLSEELTWGYGTKLSDLRHSQW